MKLINKTSTKNPKTFGPLFGFILANILSRVVMAKYFPFQITYDPNPWLAYNKPLPILHEHHDYPKWYPIKNHYNFDEINYNYPNTILTPAPPHDDLTPPALSPPPPQLPLPPPPPILQDYQDNYADENKIVTTIDNVNEPIPAESNNNRRRQTYKRTTIKPKRTRYPQKRRRTTTTPPPPPEYYDSYDEYNDDRRPYYDDNIYEDDDDDYDSIEHTTKRYRRKKPTRPTRRRTQTTETINYDDTDEGQQTEIVIVRQRQTTTTTTITPTTTEPQTIITNGTTTETPTTTYNSTKTTNSTGGYGYGPFSGNDQISITYGPPFQYSAPYIDWYSDATSNSIIKRVRNIVGVDRKSSKFNKID